MSDNETIATKVKLEFNNSHTKLKTLNDFLRYTVKKGV